MSDISALHEAATPDPEIAFGFDEGNGDEACFTLTRNRDGYMEVEVQAFGKTARILDAAFDAYLRPYPDALIEAVGDWLEAIDEHGYNDLRTAAAEHRIRVAHIRLREGTDEGNRAGSSAGCSEPTRCGSRDKAECEWCQAPFGKEDLSRLREGE